MTELHEHSGASERGALEPTSLVTLESLAVMVVDRLNRLWRTAAGEKCRQGLRLKWLELGAAGSHDEG